MRLTSIRDKKINNNIIERFHSTFRERDKVMRGFKTEHTAQQLSEGFNTWYNFIRPHQALNGLTPSEMAGINLGLNGENRWLDLIRLSANNQNNGVKKDKKKWEFKPKKFDKFILKVFDKDGNELDCKELGFKKYYHSREKAQEFINFFKDLHPRYIYKIEENN